MYVSSRTITLFIFQGVEYLKNHITFVLLLLMNLYQPLFKLQLMHPIFLYPFYRHSSESERRRKIYLCSQDVQAVRSSVILMKKNKIILRLQQITSPQVTLTDT